MRIPQDGLENHFVRESGVCVELHNPPVPGDEILDVGAGFIRQRPSSATCVRSKPSKVGFVITPVFYCAEGCAGLPAIASATAGHGRARCEIKKYFMAPNAA